MTDPIASLPGASLPPKKKLAREERDLVVQLFREGLDAKTIAREKNFYGKTVSGIVSAAQKRGELPSPSPARFDRPQFNNPQPALQPQYQPPIQPQVQSPDLFNPEPVLPENPPMTTPVAAPAPQDPRQPAPAALPTDDFSGGRPVLGGSGGFTSPMSQVKYTVERIIPPDGVLGTHYGSFSIEELATQYGAGTYNVTRKDPSMRVDQVFTQKVGDSYGPPKFPNHSGPSQTSAGRPMPHAQPFRPTYARPWEQGPASGAPETEAPRPLFRAESDRSLYGYARHDQTDAARAAIETIDHMHQRHIESLESQRKNNPENFITKVLETQNEGLMKRMDEERKQESDRRQEEEARFERRQKEELARFEAAQKAEQAKHDREIERIRADAEGKLKLEKQQAEERERRDRLDREEREKRASEERKFLLDLEEKKIQLVKSEAEATERRLKAELERTMQQAKDIQEAAARQLQSNSEDTQAAIEQMKRETKEQLDRERETLEQMHKLKEKHFEQRQVLEREMLQMQKESLDKQAGNEVFNTVNTIIKEGSKAVEKFVDLQKYQSMTNMAPEAQIAAASRGALDGTGLPVGHGGNAQQKSLADTAGRPVEQNPRVDQMPPAASQQQQPQPAVRTSQAAPPAPAAGGGQPSSPPASLDNASFVESKMEGLIRAQLKSQIAAEILNEWSVHVDSESDATAFANMFLEMMRDETNGEQRKACAAFATFIKPRKWKQVYKIIRPEVNDELRAIFDKPHAEAFYEQFRAMIVYQVHDYWVNFMAQQQNKQTPPEAGGQMQQMPPAPPAAPGGGEAPPGNLRQVG